MKSLIFLLLTLLILTGCSQLESLGYKWGEDLSRNALGEEKEADPFEENCMREAAKLVPIEVMLFNTSGWYLKEFTFLDGILDAAPSIRYQPGVKEGENINYLYPSNLIESNYVRYRRQIISETGTILGDRHFQVQLVLEPSDDEPIIRTDTRFSNEVISKRFLVKDMIIKNCEWIAG